MEFFCSKCRKKYHSNEFRKPINHKNEIIKECCNEGKLIPLPLSKVEFPNFDILFCYSETPDTYLIVPENRKKNYLNLKFNKLGIFTTNISAKEYFEFSEFYKDKSKYIDNLS